MGRGGVLGALGGCWKGKKWDEEALGGSGGEWDGAGMGLGGTGMGPNGQGGTGMGLNGTGGALGWGQMGLGALGWS